jgi:hypothetical protein
MSVFWGKRHGADAVVRVTDIPLRTHDAAVRKATNGGRRGLSSNQSYHLSGMIDNRTKAMKAAYHDNVGGISLLFSGCTDVVSFRIAL